MYSDRGLPERGADDAGQRFFSKLGLKLSDVGAQTKLD